MNKIIIFGASSAIAEQTARLFARNGDRLFLIARQEAQLQIMASDLKGRGAESVDYAVADATEYERHEALFDAASTSMDGFNILLIAYGTLPNQTDCQNDTATLLHTLNTNFTSAAALMERAAGHMEKQKEGVIAVISSVAGDRGRQSNYVYGSAKSALSSYASGLRNRLFKSGVRVVTIKPGFVDTPMTAEFDKGALWASPKTIAEGIYKAITVKGDIVYLPGFWRLIMMIIRTIPEFIFKRLGL